MVGDWCPDEDYAVVLGDEMTWDCFIDMWYEIGWRYAWEVAARLQGFEVRHDGTGTIIRHPNALRYIDLI